jgi:hypothetical protein
MITFKASLKEKVVLTVDEPVQNKPFDLILDRSSKTLLFDLDEIPVEQQTQAERDKL